MRMFHHFLMNRCLRRGMVVAAIEKDNPKLCSKLVSLSFRSPGSPF